MARLSRRYNVGHGVPRDRDQGLHWLRRAADAGGPSSMASLGLFYATAHMGLPRDDD